MKPCPETFGARFIVWTVSRGLVMRRQDYFIDTVSGFDSEVARLFDTGCLIIFSQSQYCIYTCINVVKFRHRLPFTGHFGKPVIILVDAVFRQKVETHFRRTEIVLIPAELVIEIRVEPENTPLVIQAFVGLGNGSAFIDVRQVSAIFPVDTVLFPERQCYVKQFMLKYIPDFFERTFSDFSNSFIIF